jgi:hypothetical protein
MAVINESSRKKRGGCRSQEQGKEKVQSLQLEEKLEAA